MQPQEKYIYGRKTSYAIPLGIGYKSKLYGTLAFAIETKFRYTFEDDLDFVSNKNTVSKCRRNWKRLVYVYRIFFNIYFRKTSLLQQRILKLWKKSDFIDLQRIPKHVAIIMDGNGRWAKEKGMNRIFGHQKCINSSSRIR